MAPIRPSGTIQQWPGADPTAATGRGLAALRHHEARLADSNHCRKGPEPYRQVPVAPNAPTFEVERSHCTYVSYLCMPPCFRLIPTLNAWNAFQMQCALPRGASYCLEQIQTAPRREGQLPASCVKFFVSFSIPHASRIHTCLTI